MDKCKHKTSERWIRNKNDEIAVNKYGCWFDEDLANKSIWFIENFCYLSKDFAGKQFILQDWQKDFISRLFGWLIWSDDFDSPVRRFKDCWLEIPRKNGKSQILSAIAEMCLVTSPRQIDIISASGDREQAEYIFNAAKTSILTSPDLSPEKNSNRIVDVRAREILYTPTNSRYYTIGDNPDKAHGTNPTIGIIDEIHVLKDNRMIEGLRTGQGARQNRLMLYTTTAGFPNTIYEEMHEYYKAVQDDVIENINSLSCIYGLNKNDDWEDESLWRLANPNLGISCKMGFLKEEYQKAIVSVSEQISFRRLFLNQIVQAENKWINLKDWDACKGTMPNLSEFDTYAGLDLAETQDMTANILLHYDPRSELIYVEPRFYLPHEVLLDTTKRLHTQYLTWYQQGFLKTTEGKTIKHRVIKEDILALNEKHHVREMSMDPFQGILLAEDLEPNGIKTFKFVQSVGWYTQPCKELEKAIADKRLVHDGNPILRWMADNVVLDSDASGKCMPSKQKSNEKIDGITALVMALDRVIRNRNKKDETSQPTGKVIWI